MWRGFSFSPTSAGLNAGLIRMDFTKLDGLIPAVIQDADSNEVLMVGFMNADALAHTLNTGLATFFSRSRQSLWTKGETSGNKLSVVEVKTDCDDDTVLVRVKRMGDGNVCHTGRRTCFFRDIPVPRPGR
jgi:phosphoribosyl-AMP cyclohydrolase